MPKFEQSIDRTRPRVCLTENPKNSGQLVYKYEDNGEVVSVPNIWYNQGTESRVNYWKWLASEKRKSADEYRKQMVGIKPQKQIDCVCGQLLESAEKLDKIAKDVAEGKIFV